MWLLIFPGSPNLRILWDTLFSNGLIIANICWLDMKLIETCSSLKLEGCYFDINGVIYWCRLGYTVEKIHTSSFHLSEERSHGAALSVASSWNTAVNVLKSLCKGDNWTLFVKVFYYISSCCLIISHVSN